MPDQSMPAVDSTSAVAPPEYISNPFKLLWTGFELLGVNVEALILWVVSSLGLILAVVPGLIVLLAGIHNTTAVVVGIVLLAAGVVALVIVGLRLYAMGVLIYLANVRGQKVEFRQLYADAKPFAYRLAGLSIVLGLITIVGFLFFIVPGVLFIYWYALATYILVDQNVGIGESMKRSRELVRGHGWETYGMYSAPQIVSLLESIPLFGFVISILVGFGSGSAYALRYVQLKALKDSDAQKPAVSAWNQVATLAIPVLFIIFVASVVLLAVVGKQD